MTTTKHGTTEVHDDWTRCRVGTVVDHARIVVCPACGDRGRLIASETTPEVIHERWGHVVGGMFLRIDRQKTCGLETAVALPPYNTTAIAAFFERACRDARGKNGRTEVATEAARLAAAEMRARLEQRRPARARAAQPAARARPPAGCARRGPAPLRGRGVAARRVARAQGIAAYAIVTRGTAMSPTITIEIYADFARVAWPAADEPAAWVRAEAAAFMVAETEDRARLERDHVIASDAASVGAAAEALAIRLRRWGCDVALGPAAGFVARHARCHAGVAFTPEAWRSTPAIEQPDVEGGFFEQRRCGCGSHVSLGSMVFERGT